MEQKMGWFSRKSASLPQSWEQSLAGCNFWLARRTMSDIITLMSQEARKEGKTATWRNEFLDGWEAFAAAPCHATALAWLQTAQADEETICGLLDGCRPGGKFYREGFKAIKDFTIGPYKLGMSLAACGRLIELTADEYKIFPRQFKGETIYHALSFTLFGKCTTMIGAIGPRIYKISSSNETDGQADFVQVMKQTLSYCESAMGTPSEEGQGFFCWQSSDGNVILQTAAAGRTFAVNIFITAAFIRGIAPTVT